MVSHNRNTLVRNIRKVSNRKLPKGNDYNCYCFAAYTVGLSDDITWIGTDKMRDYLDQTEQIDKPNPGDIVAMWGDDLCFNQTIENKSMRLIHTMIYVSKDRYLHKPGGLELEYASWRRVLELYSPSDGFVINKVTYHRI